MIAHDLLQYYEKIPVERRIPPGYAYYARDIIAPVISREGQLLQIRFYASVSDETDEGSLPFVSRCVPDIGRGNTVLAYVPSDTLNNTLAASLAYVPTKKAAKSALNKGRKKALDFVDRLNSLPSSCAPLIKFFENGQDKILAEVLWGMLPTKEDPGPFNEALAAKYFSGTPPKIDSTLRVAFCVEGTPGFLHSHPEILEYWKEHYNRKRASGLYGWSSVTGEEVELAKLHGSDLKIGYMSSPVSFASANCKAFKPWGFEGATCSGLSLEESYRYTRVLQYLGSSDRHHYSLENDKVAVFWASEEGAEDCLWGGCLKPDPEYVNALLESLTRGSETPQTSKDGSFSLMWLKNNSGRLCVDDYYKGSLSVVRANIAKWCEDLRVVDRNGKDCIPSLWALATAHMTFFPANKKRDMLRRTTKEATQMMSACLRTGPLPQSIPHRLHLVIARQVANGGKESNNHAVTPTQAALLRLVFNRNPDRKSGPIMLQNPNEVDNPAFHFGRLVLRMLEAQHAVMGHTNDKYKMLKRLLKGQPKEAWAAIQRRYAAWCCHSSKNGRLYPMLGVDEVAEIMVSCGWLTVPEQFSVDDLSALSLGWYCQEGIDYRERRMKAKGAG